MADEPDKSGQEPNLELPPLLGFGRKKKRKRGATQEEPATEESVAEETTAIEIGGDEPVSSDPAAAQGDPLAADPVAKPSGGIAPAAGAAMGVPPVPPPSTREEPPAQQITPPPVERDEQPPVEEPVVVEAPVVEEPAVEEPVVGEAVVQAPIAPEEPVTIEEPVLVEETQSQVPDQRAVLAERSTEHTTVPPTYKSAPPPPIGSQHEESLGWPEGEGADEPVPEPVAPPRTRTSRSLPVINPRVAALVTGGLVGLLGIGLALIASRGCESIRGVGSCGGLGLLALLAIVAIQVIVGAILLKAWRLSDPASTSFLGVGLVAVFVLLFLLSSLESTWMVVVIPVLTALTFLISWWVTATFVEGIGDDLTR